MSDVDTLAGALRKTLFTDPELWTLTVGLKDRSVLTVENAKSVQALPGCLYWCDDAGSEHFQPWDGIEWAESKPQ